MPRGRLPLRTAAAIVLALGVLVAFRGPISRALAAFAIDAATGYRVAFDALDLRPDHARVDGLVVSHGSEPIATVRSLFARYDLRDFLPWAKQSGGLRDVSVSGLAVTLVRHADGSFNLGSIQLHGGGAGPAGGGGPPMRFTLAVADSRVIVTDPYRRLPGSRRIELDDVNARGAIDTASESRVRVRAAVSTAGMARAAIPLALDARSDARLGFALYRLTADRLPLRDLVNYAINAPSAQFLAGEVRALDVRAYALDLNAAHPQVYHFAGGAMLGGAAMNVPGLRVPLRSLDGRIDVFDAGIAAPAARGMLAGIPIAITGALYDWTAPQFRLGLHASAGLENVRALFRFSRRLPIAGALTLGALVEGPVSDPLVAVRFTAPSIAYDRFPGRAVAGDAVYYDSALVLAPVTAEYGPLHLAVRGDIDLGVAASSQLVVAATAPAGSIPYVAQTVPGAPLHAAGVLTGSDLALEARGVFDGSGAGDAIAGTFHIDRFGDGIIGPFRASRADGTSLAGAYYANRASSESGFWLDARDFAFANVQPSPELPGLPSLVPPQFGARVDAVLAGEGSPANFRIAGNVSGGALAFGTVRVDRFAGGIAGSPSDLRVANLSASGPWGDFTGDGGYTRGAIALRGEYRGSFERLRAFTGDLGATGAIAGPVTLMVAHDRTVVQTAGASSPGATVHGVPVDAVRGTLAVDGKTLRVYAAAADVAGGALVAAGGFGDRGETLGVSLGGADARRLRGTGLPASDGAIDAIGTVVKNGGAPRFDGGVSVAGARVRGVAVSANGNVRAGPQRVDVGAGSVLAGPAVADASGTLTHLGKGGPDYAIDVRAHDVPAAPLVRLAYPKRRDVAGTIDAALTATGRGAALPHVAGTLDVPEGTFNGQAFRAARVTVDAGAGTIAASDGRIVVGSTAVAFGALVRGQDVALSLDAPKADLSDFDDLFDTGDTLGGTGHVAGRFDKHGAAVATSGDATIAQLRYRRFDLGDTDARWTSAGRTVTTQLAFGGPSGQLQANGTVTLAAGAPVDRFLQRSRFAGTAVLKQLDLGTWLPVFGYQVPVAGRVDATASVTGPLNAPILHADATLDGGVLGKFPVQKAHATFDAGLTGADVREAQFQLSSLLLTGSGHVGFGEHDPLALALHATSADIGDLTSRFFATKLTLTGTGEVDVRVAGQRAKPEVTGGFDIEKAALDGVQFPRVLGQFQLEGRNVVVSGAELNFAKGALLLAGSVPFTFSPFAFGPAEAPISLDVSAQGIDLTNFAPLVHDSTIAGKIDGRVAIGGTAGSPSLSGDVGLTGGAFTSPAEAVPLTNVGAKLTFNGNTVRLDGLHAEAGGGTFDGRGSATLSDLVHPGADASYAFDATAKGLRLDIPALGRGQVDGKASITHHPGAPPLIAADATLQDAVIPFSALLLAGAGGGGGGLDIPAEAGQARQPFASFDVKVTAGTNVRVRSANVDIGGRGTLAVAGTSVAPTLTGQFVSTGGTLAYFNRVFRIQSGTVTFAPDQGVIPTLKAVATAHVSNSDPNPVRNPGGTADVTVDVNGPVTNLNIQLSSDPPYDREQILGLLLGAPAIGATNIFGNETPGQQLNLAGVPQTTAANRSTEFSVGQEAFGVVNAQFTRALLAPLESAFGDALGLSSFAVNIDYGGGVGLSARKILGRNVNFIYATSFSYPYRQTFGFDIKPNPSTAMQVTVFQTIGAYSFGQTVGGSYLFNPLQPVNQRATAAQPSTGTVGFSLSLQRLFR